MNGFHCVSRQWVMYGLQKRTINAQKLVLNSSLTTVAWMQGCLERPTYWRYGVYTSIDYRLPVALPLPFFPMYIFPMYTISLV